MSDGPATETDTNAVEIHPADGDASNTARGPRRVYLHIGLMKSGTTFLQQLLARHREALAADSVLFPGRDYARQVAGVRDLLDLRGPLTGAELDGAWSALAAEISAWDGDAVILSVEHLSLARSTQIRTLVDALSPAELRVVITARDMARVLPSSWQETVQNALTWSWEDFVASVTGAPAAMNAPAKRFWRQHGLVDIIDRWSVELGMDSIRVVTVPPDGAGPEVLWDRFCSTVALDSSRYPITGFDQPINASLDRDAAELLRRLNVRLGDQLEQPQYVRFVKRPLAKRVLAQLPTSRPLTLSDAELAWAVRHGEHIVAGLERRDVQVVGDLRELVPDRDEQSAEAGAYRGDAHRIADVATVVADALIKEIVAANRAPEPAGRGRAPAGDGTPP